VASPASPETARWEVCGLWKAAGDGGTRHDETGLDTRTEEQSVP
jgi:hypothetical protein